MPTLKHVTPSASKKTKKTKKREKIAAAPLIEAPVQSQKTCSKSFRGSCLRVSRNGGDHVRRI